MGWVNCGTHITYEERRASSEKQDGQKALQVVREWRRGGGMAFSVCCNDALAIPIHRAD